MGLKIDYDNMVTNGCFSFAMGFIIFLAGYDLYPRNKWLGAFVLVVLCMFVFFYINDWSIKSSECKKSQW